MSYTGGGVEEGAEYDHQQGNHGRSLGVSKCQRGPCTTFMVLQGDTIIVQSCTSPVTSQGRMHLQELCLTDKAVDPCQCRQSKWGGFFVSINVKIC